MSNILPRLICRCSTHWWGSKKSSFITAFLYSQILSGQPKQHRQSQHLLSLISDNASCIFPRKKKSKGKSRSVHKSRSHKGSTFKQRKKSCIYRVTWKPGILNITADWPQVLIKFVLCQHSPCKTCISRALLPAEHVIQDFRWWFTQLKGVKEW